MSSLPAVRTERASTITATPAFNDLTMSPAAPDRIVTGLPASDIGKLPDSEVISKISDIATYADQERRERDRRGGRWNIAQKGMVSAVAIYGVVAAGSMLADLGLGSTAAAMLLAVGGTIGAFAKVFDARGRAASNLLSRDEWKHIRDAAEIAAAMTFAESDSRYQELLRINSWMLDRGSRDTNSR